MRPDLAEFTLPALPDRMDRRTRGGVVRQTMEARIRTITCIYGGSTETRKVDTVDVIRVPTVIGHLRFWWRALEAERFSSAKELYVAEAALWGAATRKGKNWGRSHVEVQVMEVCHAQASNKAMASAPNYALWPARPIKQELGGEVYLPGLEFTLRIAFPPERRDELERTLKAWVWFGGYGGRTRRGAGALVLLGVRQPGQRPSKSGWIPSKVSSALIEGLMSPHAASEQSGWLANVPRLRGAGLCAQPRPGCSPRAAWDCAVAWLSNFRQSNTGQHPARESGGPDHRGRPRPGPSRWPEPDKIRHLSAPIQGKGHAHDPQHNADSAWPRAGFGLPIQVRFQQQGRDGRRWDQQRPPLTEPDNVELVWAQGRETFDRLASPLIVKPLALADGYCEPIALWLTRSYPEGGRVQVKGKPRSEAPFDKLIGDGEAPRFAPLQHGLEAPSGHRLRRAFFWWLKQQGVTEVMP